MPKTKPAFQITRMPNPHKVGTYDYQLRETSTGKLVLGEYRQRSPIAPRNLLQAQATLNTKAFFDGAANQLAGDTWQQIDGVKTQL